MSILQLGGEEIYRNSARPSKAPAAITISADLNRYREIEIFGCTDEYVRCSCRLFKPDKADTSYTWDQLYFSMQAQNISNGHVYLRYTVWTISQTASGAKFTPTSFMETDFGDSGCTTYGDSGISIVRISGWV